MSAVEHRSLCTDVVEVRAELREISGLAVPFNVPTEVRSLGASFTETFQPGSFTKTIAERGDRVPLFVQHAHDRLAIGKSTELREESRGLFATFKVSRTTAGDEALELARDGVASAFSIGFRPITDDWTSQRSVTRREVALHEVSLTSMPVYEGALIEAVRSEDVLPIAEARALLQRHRADVLPVSDAYRRLIIVLEGTRNDD